METVTDPTDSNLQSIKDNWWRFGLADYAEHMSADTDLSWLPYNHLVYICEKVEEAVRKGNGRIIINMPPRHGKSETLSKWLPRWFLDWNPDKKVILASYAAELARGFGRAVRDYFQDDRTDTWTTVRADKDAADEWETPQGGGMTTAGLDGGITGKGGHLIIVDDPIKNWQEAESPTRREHIKNWWDSTLWTRKEPGCTVIVIQTRWHEDDLSGWLLNEEEREDWEDWTVIKLPALCEEVDEETGVDELGRSEGEALCPERFTAEELEKEKRRNEQVWAGLFQQRPAPLEGGIIKRDWIQHYQKLPDDPLTYWQSWDFTFKDTGTSWIVGQLWGQLKANFYLVDQVRFKADFVKAKEAMRLKGIRNPSLPSLWHRARLKLVEDKANGPAIISSLKNEVPGIVPVSPKGSKKARLSAVAPFFEAKNVWLPPKSQAKWIRGFIEEITTYPGAANDDQVDACSQALSRGTDSVAAARRLAAW